MTDRERCWGVKQRFDLSRSSWSKVPLGQLVQFKDGQRRPVKSSERRAGPYPYYGANGQLGTIDGYLFDEDLVLLAEDGGYFEPDDPRPIAYTISGKAWVNNHAHVLAPRDQIDYQFLSYQLSNYDIRRFLSGSTRDKLTKSSAEQIPIILPPLSEQRRIVDILNRANGIRRLRREALDKARQLIPALFVDMFGDPATNPRGWPSSRIADVLHVKGGKRLPKGSRYSATATPYRYLRGTDISPGRIAREQMLFLSEEVQRSIRRYTIEAGDVVITIAGKIGIAAPIGVDLAGVNLTENAAKLTARQPGIVEPIFLSWLLNSKFVQDQIEVLTGRVTIGKLALERIERLRLLLPPYTAQQEFAERASDIQATIAQQERMAEASDQLIASLMAQLFDGGISTVRAA